MSTFIRYSIMDKRVYKDCMISICSWETLVDLIEFDILDFDFTLLMDWLYSCYASLDYQTRVVGF